MRELLGGKGANVAEMARVLGVDRVPAGLTITTDACVAYLREGGREPEGLDAQVLEAKPGHGRQLDVHLDLARPVVLECVRGRSSDPTRVRRAPRRTRLRRVAG